MISFNVDRVELARRRLGITKNEFSISIDIDRKGLYRFESGKYDLPNDAKEKLLILTGYPESFFGKASPEYPNPKGVSFRSLRSLTASVRDAAMAAGALAFELDDWVSAEYKLPEHDVFVDRELAAEEAAIRLRVMWNIGLRPIGNMINLLEAHGVRVFSLAEETRHLDAYSLWRNNKPYIFLNTMKTSERSRFDAAHELGHLILHFHAGSTHPKAEIEADTFASSFLMPEDDVKAEIRFVRNIKDIIEKKARWGVSAAALAYKLHRIKKVTDWNYRNYCIELGKYGRDKEPSPIPRETSLVWTKILTDLWRRGISISRLSHRLSIPENEINALLFGIASQMSRQEPKPLRLVN